MTIQSAAFLSGVRRLAPDQFVEGILSGNRRVLSRFITLLESRLVEDRRLAQHVLTALLPHTGRSASVLLAYPERARRRMRSAESGNGLSTFELRAGKLKFKD